MRVLHLITVIFAAAILLTLAREAAGRVAIIVFFAGLGELFFGLVAIMTLFRTIGAIGHADRPLAYFQAIAATAIVLILAALTMNGLLVIGGWLVQSAVD